MHFHLFQLSRSRLGIWQALVDEAQRQLHIALPMRRKICGNASDLARTSIPNEPEGFNDCDQCKIVSQDYQSPRLCLAHQVNEALLDKYRK